MLTFESRTFIADSIFFSYSHRLSLRLQRHDCSIQFRHKHLKCSRAMEIWIRSIVYRMFHVDTLQTSTDREFIVFVVNAGLVCKAAIAVYIYTLVRRMTIHLHSTCCDVFLIAFVSTTSSYLRIQLFLEYIIRIDWMKNYTWLICLPLKWVSTPLTPLPLWLSLACSLSYKLLFSVVFLLLLVRCVWSFHRLIHSFSM